MNKTGQNPTKLASVNPLTGLTPLQEQCASLLAAGERISVVAEKVQVSRTTIYQWKEVITFQCFMNQLRDEVKAHMNQTLLSLAEEALSAIRETLASDNPSLRLKAAIWLVERLSSVEVGQCNPFKALKEEATYPNDLAGWDFSAPEFHMEDYKRKLKELGLKEPQ